MKTLSYIYSNEEDIELGNTYYFGQLWDGNGDGEELLDSGAICIGEDEDNMPIIVWFKIIEENHDSLQARIKVTDIY